MHSFAKLPGFNSNQARLPSAGLMKEMDSRWILAATTCVFALSTASKTPDDDFGSRTALPLHARSADSLARRLQKPFASLTNTQLWQTLLRERQDASAKLRQNTPGQLHPPPPARGSLEADLHPRARQYRRRPISRRRKLQPSRSDQLSRTVCSLTSSAIVATKTDKTAQMSTTTRSPPGEQVVPTTFTGSRSRRGPRVQAEARAGAGGEGGEQGGGQGGPGGPGGQEDPGGCSGPMGPMGPSALCAGVSTQILQPFGAFFPGSVRLIPRVLGFGARTSVLSPVAFGQGASIAFNPSALTYDVQSSCLFLASLKKAFER